MKILLEIETDEMSTSDLIKLRDLLKPQREQVRQALQSRQVKKRDTPCTCAFRHPSRIITEESVHYSSCPMWREKK